MPTRVERPSNESLPREPMSPMGDSHIGNRNAQHRDALRLALGSILAPKRPHMSRSSSGSATPASHSFCHTPSSVPTPPPPPHPTPICGSGRTTSEHHFSHLYSHHHHHPHHHQHHPSRLSETHPHDEDFSSPTSSNASSEALPLIMDSGVPSPRDEHPSSMPEDGLLVHQPVPISAHGHATGDEVPVVVISRSQGGSGTPKAKFIQTLQSKSAWDALIHGSFS